MPPDHAITVSVVPMEQAGSSDRPVETPSTRHDGRRRSGPVRPDGSSCRFISSLELVPLVVPALVHRTKQRRQHGPASVSSAGPHPYDRLVEGQGAGRFVEVGVAEGEDASVGSDLAITNVPHREDGSSQLRERREAERIQMSP